MEKEINNKVEETNAVFLKKAEMRIEDVSANEVLKTPTTKKIVIQPSDIIVTPPAIEYTLETCISNRDTAQAEVDKWQGYINEIQK